MGDKSTVIDCNEFVGDVKKISLVACRKCEVVISKANLEMLVMNTMPQLTVVEGMSQHLELKDLTISRTNKFNRFDDIKALKNILFLNLSENKALEDINFLKEHPNLIFLDLIRCSNLELMNIIEVLQTIKSLKHVNISLKKKEMLVFLEALPNIYINSQRNTNR